MADAAELHDDSQDDFDAEFEAARVAEEEGGDEDAELDAAGEGEEGDGGGGAEGENVPAAAAAKPAADAEKAARAVKNLDKALKAERREKRELAAKLASIEERLNAKPVAAASVEDAMPDPVEDPIGWMSAAQKLIDAMKGRDAQQARDYEASQARNRQMSALHQRVQESEDDFRADHPDYNDAAAHLQASIRDELAEQGFTGQELQAEFTSRMLGIATRAIQAGKDVAEVSYNLAKRRGFAAPAPAPAPTPEATPAPAVDATKAALDKIKAGQEASKTLTGGAGRGSGDRLTMAAVAELKGAAFDSAFEKLRQQERRA